MRYARHRVLDVTCALPRPTILGMPSQTKVMTTTSAPLTVPPVSTTAARAQWLVLIAAFLGWMFDGLEMGIFPLVARPALQSMLHQPGATGSDTFVGVWMSYITALFLVGAAAGGLVFGWLGDRVGRVR